MTKLDCCKILTKNWLIICVAMFMITGCVPRRKTVLFQIATKDTLNVQVPPEYRVQTGDVLFIKVQSLDEKASAFINGAADAQARSQITQSEQNLYYEGYEVSPFGNIYLPYLDSLKVNGLTTNQIAGMLTDSLTPFVKEALITVKLASFRVSVLGEVQNPGTFLFYRTRVSIFEALALAKPTEYYNAANVVITRQFDNNKLKIERFDLTSDKIINSPYYYLKPNDLIYVEPLKVKKYGFNTFPYALLLSTISTIMLIYSVFNN